MHFNRDLVIRMGGRQLNWLRCEHLKRVFFFSTQWRTLVFRFVLQESSLNLRARSLAYQRLTSLSKSSRGTQHSTRCWVSGRSRQAFRKTLLARMHFRAALAGGFLPQLGLQRT